VHVSGTPFVAVAIVNIDDYFTPVQELMRQTGLSAGDQIQRSIGESTGSSRHKMVTFATGGIISLLFLAALLAIGFARVVSKPIMALRDAVQSMGSGNLNVQVPEKGAKEMK
jgi:nitrogen fixation/metabolism regulation signal transduction histidine kinase